MQILKEEDDMTIFTLYVILVGVLCVIVIVATIIVGIESHKCAICEKTKKYCKGIPEGEEYLGYALRICSSCDKKYNITDVFKFKEVMLKIHLDNKMKKDEYELKERMIIESNNEKWREKQSAIMISYEMLKNNPINTTKGGK